MRLAIDGYAIPNNTGIHALYILNKLTGQFQNLTDNAIHSLIGTEMGMGEIKMHRKQDSY